MQEFFVVNEQTNEKTNAGVNITKCKDVVNFIYLFAVLLFSFVFWCRVVWCGVVWCGVVWCGVVWCGVVWCGVVWAINLSKNTLYKYTDFI